jgi:CheY-like chemotaxis protein
MIRFLLVDDETTLRVMLGHVLRESFPGADVRPAPDHRQALRIARSFNPAIVITDYYHPGGTGVDLLQQLRRDPKTRRTPVVLATAMQTMEHELRRVGFNAVLFKPFDREDFVEFVTRVLTLDADLDAEILDIPEESRSLEYLEAVELGSDDGRAALAKEVMAMANSGGGTIVVGVKEVWPGDFAATGIGEAAAETLETGRVRAALQDYLEPPVQVAVKRVRDGSRRFALLRIPNAGEALVQAAKWNVRAGLEPGHVYARDGAKGIADVGTWEELRALLEERRWKASD